MNVVKTERAIRLHGRIYLLEEGVLRVFKEDTECGSLPMQVVAELMMAALVDQRNPLPGPEHMGAVVIDGAITGRLSGGELNAQKRAAVVIPADVVAGLRPPPAEPKAESKRRANKVGGAADPLPASPEEAAIPAAELAAQVEQVHEAVVEQTALEFVGAAEVIEEAPPKPAQHPAVVHEVELLPALKNATRLREVLDYLNKGPFPAPWNLGELLAKVTELQPQLPKALRDIKLDGDRLQRTVEAGGYELVG